MYNDLSRKCVARASAELTADWFLERTHTPRCAAENTTSSIPHQQIGVCDQQQDRADGAEPRGEVGCPERVFAPCSEVSRRHRVWSGNVFPLFMTACEELGKSEHWVASDKYVGVLLFISP